MGITYPIWICHDCATSVKKMSKNHIATYHMDTCSICNRQVAVTQPRDYGHFDNSELLRMEARAKVLYGTE